MPVLLPLLLSLLAAPVTAVVCFRRPRWAAPVAAVAAALAFSATLWGWWIGGATINIPWAPSWDLRLHFSLDGLAALYALLATGIGLAVIIYSAGYMPHHLKEEGRPEGDAVRFYALVLLFMGAMVGLVVAQDLFLLFLFWDLTTITSYFLIGYDHEKVKARRAALSAFLVTGIASILFIIGALILYNTYGSFSLPDLVAQARPGLPLTVATALMGIAALAKSAQVPFHVWLPRAMVAPTPVSAYLHSAAMVAAGVFLLERLYPLLHLSDTLRQALLVVGLLTIAIGGLLALTQDVLKRVLAYSTISQYGYVVVLLGLGGRLGVAAASFYVLAHGLIKSTLFLSAGAVTQATGENRLSAVGGLRREMPLLALGSGAAAAGLAALPLTIGFFKDELLFKTALEHGWPMAILAMLAAALTLAYIWRFWQGIFLGKGEAEVHPLPGVMVAPVVVLGLLVLAGGIVVDPFARLAQAAGAAAYGPILVEPAYHFDLRPENLLALGAYGLGIVIIVARPLWSGAATATAEVGKRFGPDRWYRRSLSLMNRLSTRIYQMVVPDLAGRLASILIPLAVLLLIGLIATRSANTYQIGTIQLGELPLVLTLLLTAVAAFIVIRPRFHLTQVLALASLSFSLAGVFAFFGAPDVALVQVLIGTVSTFFFLAILVLLPAEALQREASRSERGIRRWREPIVSLIAGVFAFIVVWASLSQSAAAESVAYTHARLAGSAHAGDVVTAILADFRGLDTMGEITVIGVALVGITMLLYWGREE